MNAEYYGAGDGDAYTSALVSSETVVLLRGKICWHFHDENGKETECVVLDADGDLRMLNEEKDRWHSLECQESGSVLLECKDGAYRPLLWNLLRMERRLCRG